MPQYLIEFKHDSRHLGLDGLGMLLVTANSFSNACIKILNFSIRKENSATHYEWDEYYENARDFINLTIT